MAKKELQKVQKEPQLRKTNAGEWQKGVFYPDLTFRLCLTPVVHLRPHHHCGSLLSQQQQ